MKKTILALMSVLAAQVFARTWTNQSDGVEWWYSVSNGTATVERRPGWNWHSWTKVGWAVEIPAEFEGFPTTKIGQQAFADGSMTEIVIPTSVVEIADGAFMGSRVASFRADVPEIGASAFRHCLNLVDFADRAAGSIPAYCFAGSRIRDFSASSVTNVGEGAFMDCPRVRNFSLLGLGGVADIKAKTFMRSGLSGEVRLPDGVTNVGDRAFAYCTNITTVSVPAGCVVSDTALLGVGDRVVRRP